MGKLHEVIAAEETRATVFKDAISQTTAIFQSPHALEGVMQHVRATVEDDGSAGGGLHIPEVVEVVEVAETVTGRVRQIVQAFDRFADVIVDKEFGNTVAKAALIVDGEELGPPEMPATFLLSMENKLKPLLTVLRAIPVHDMKTDWVPHDGRPNVMKGRSETRTITKKVERSKVVVDPTEHQPGQYHIFTEDMKVGEKTITALSGKWSPTQKARIIERVENLICAFRQARQRANEVEVEAPSVDFISNYILDGV